MSVQSTNLHKMVKIENEQRLSVEQSIDFVWVLLLGMMNLMANSEEKKTVWMKEIITDSVVIFKNFTSN